MAVDRILEITRSISGELKLPYAGSKVVSERLLSLAYLFGQIGDYPAEGCFKAMAVEVAQIERNRARLIEHYRDALMLLEGWIAKHCPQCYRAEHEADLQRKRALLEEVERGA